MSTREQPGLSKVRKAASRVHIAASPFHSVDNSITQHGRTHGSVSTETVTVPLPSLVLPPGCAPLSRIDLDSNGTMCGCRKLTKATTSPNYVVTVPEELAEADPGRRAVEGRISRLLRCHNGPIELTNGLPGHQRPQKGPCFGVRASVELRRFLPN